MNTSSACTSLPYTQKLNGPQTINLRYSLNAGGQSSFPSTALGMEVSPDYSPNSYTVHSGSSIPKLVPDSLKPDKSSPKRHWPHETHSNRNWLNGLENESAMNSQLDAMTIPQFGDIPTPDRMFATDTIPTLESIESEASMQVRPTWYFPIPSNTNTNTYNNNANMEILSGEMYALD